MIPQPPLDLTMILSLGFLINRWEWVGIDPTSVLNELLKDYPGDDVLSV